MRYHVLVSIAGIHRMEGGTAHYSGKREQQSVIEEGRVPRTIVPATQFHDFAALPASWTERDGVATSHHLLVQPIAPDDIAQVFRDPHRRAAGPLRRCRRSRDARLGRHGPPHQRRLGRKVKLVHTWSGPLGEEMAGNVLLPDENARIARTTFDQWPAAGALGEKRPRQRGTQRRMRV